MRVLGIDPGSLNLGWGFIETDRNLKWQRVEHDSFHVSSKLSFFERLQSLDESLSRLVADLQPDVAVIEKIFLGKNVDSAFKLGHIRGICAARCSAMGARIVEYTPRTVKKHITGSGSADKSVVQRFLYQQLRQSGEGKSLDASDALALAFCHIMQDSISLKVRGMERR